MSWNSSCTFKEKLTPHSGSRLARWHRNNLLSLRDWFRNKEVPDSWASKKPVRRQMRWELWGTFFFYMLSSENNLSSFLLDGILAACFSGCSWQVVYESQRPWTPRLSDKKKLASQRHCGAASWVTLAEFSYANQKFPSSSVWGRISVIQTEGMIKK